jgi:hypothetical protein
VFHFIVESAVRGDTVGALAKAVLENDDELAVAPRVGPSPSTPLGKVY